MNEDRHVERKALERWLTAEEGESDDAADAAFAHLFSAVPKVEAGPAFVQQAVTSAWRWRARVRRRRLIMLGTAAAVLLFAVTAVIGDGLAPQTTRLTIKGLAFVSSRAVPWLLAYTAVAMDWWWTLAGVGSTIATAVMTPARAVAVVVVELVTVLALYALRRIAGVGRLGEAQV